MSSGMGTATSQNSCIGWKDKLSSAATIPRIEVLRLRRSFASRTIDSAHHDSGSNSLTFLRGLQSQELHDHLQILPGFAFLARVAKKKRGMVGHCEFRTLPGW